jgi:hypothetical protein
MIAVAVIVAIVVLITLLRVGILVIWDGSLTLKFIVGPLRFTISSDKENAEKTVSDEKTEKQKKKSKSGSKQKSPWPKVLLSNWQELLELIGRVLRMPLLDPLVLKVTFGGEDPASGALNYGRAWALIGALMPFLERNFTIGKREIDVQLDREAKEMSVYAKAALTARIGQCIRLAISALILFIRLYNETKQTEKAVQVK